MTTKELIEKLQKVPQDKECLLGIDRSGGWPNDYIEVYPLNGVLPQKGEVNTASTGNTSIWSSGNPALLSIPNRHSLS